MLYWIYRQLFWLKLQLCPQSRNIHSTIPVYNLPWVWVGAQLDDTVESVTEVVNRYIQYGKPITPTFLKEVTGYDTNIWKYMDAMTLEEKEFPPEGIVIDDVASDKAISHSE